ncbi:hypothetical protein PIB30_104108, partial [Stylosanthes scabra]|nr:hypothetical protein [Stylosanthes scabra]
VSDATRMTIALNLVTYEYNQIGDMISERAMHYWDLEMIKSQKKGKKKTRATEIRERDSGRGMPPGTVNGVRRGERWPSSAVGGGVSSGFGRGWGLMRFGGKQLSFEL